MLSDEISTNESLLVDWELISRIRNIISTVLGAENCRFFCEKYWTKHIKNH